MQTAPSKELLEKHNISRVTIAGDTRFDRVYKISLQAKPLPLIEGFAKGSTTLVAGSTWEKDEQMLAEYIETCGHGNLKWIIAPHEVHAAHIAKITNLFKHKPLLYTNIDANTNIKDYSILIIDTIGLLSSAYQYGQMAYIGGGFGVGIHNILEAATFGLPVIFGPNYHKFKEAIDLIKLGGAFSIKSKGQLQQHLDMLIANEDKRQAASNISREYISKNLGATEIIVGATF
ncbi:MAG: hypothetical protein HC896_04980 [Bacteroidales bacterium]|nr:hypothetical protein [Bacteroidales bacterium]